MEFIDLKKQYLQNKFNIEQRINNVLAHGKFIGGQEVEELEKKRDELSLKLESTNSHDELIKLGEELGVVANQLEEAEIRWLELAEKAE